MLIYIVCRGCELLGQEPLGATAAEADGEDHTKVSENKHNREMHVDIDSLKQLIILRFPPNASDGYSQIRMTCANQVINVFPLEIPNYFKDLLTTRC